MLLIGLGLVACSGSDGNTVTMEAGQRFKPEGLTVTAGETIVFVNESNDAHSITAYEEDLPEGVPYFASGGFESEGQARDDVAAGLLSPGENFELKLDIPGTYRYFCIPHEDSSMSGHIVVEE
jgi:plastocyanin